MHRIGNLFELIASPENLHLAYYRASRGKRSQAVVREFSEKLEERTAQISEWILNGSFPLGKFHQFVIRDPKERIITAPCFDERVLHHAIMNVCEPLMDRWLIDDTYACRIGKGRERAVQRAQVFAKRAQWFLKLDIRKYFDSISHEKLKLQLRKRFKDGRLLQLLERIIFAYRGSIGVGLPIGSLTSQHFANFYLGWFDRFVKETLKLDGYVRYMDDMLLWHENVANIRTIQSQCSEFLYDHLGLEMKPVILQRTAIGVDFLGCRIWPTHVEFNRRSKRRWRRRVRVLERAERLGLLSESELQSSVTALSAFAVSASAKTWRFRQAVLKSPVVDDP